MTTTGGFGESMRRNIKVFVEPLDELNLEPKALEACSRPAYLRQGFRTARGEQENGRTVGKHVIYNSRVIALELA